MDRISAPGATLRGSTGVAMVRPRPRRWYPRCAPYRAAPEGEGHRDRHPEDCQESAHPSFGTSDGRGPTTSTYPPARGTGGGKRVGKPSRMEGPGIYHVGREAD